VHLAENQPQRCVHRDSENTFIRLGGSEMFYKNKNFVLLVIFSILVGCTFSITFSIGVFDNPNFSIQDFSMNLASELVGLVITLLMIDTYMSVRRKYYLERKTTKEASIEETAETKEDHFKTTQVQGSCAIKSVSTILDQQTGIQYVLIVHEQGSALTPLLDSDGKPVT
jgi:hypothetical protein